MKRWLRFPRHSPLARATGLALLFAFAAQDAEGAAPGRRLALVVGNAQYQSVYSLRNPVNDSRAVAETLERLGFEVVSLDNAGREEFESAVDDFSRMAEGAEATVFYFSGHGFQLEGANYLVPTDARLTSPASIEKETLRLDAIISELQSRDRQTLIFLDACRNNPLPESMRDKDGQYGLAEVEAGSGTFVAFATSPGNITRDGIGRNSPFTSALVEHMQTPGISISDMMIRVRNEVEEATAHEQTPWDQSSLRSQFYFNPEGEGEDALTDEDRELLMSLDPVLRKKFEARFGLKIESVEEDEGDELIATIVPAVTISSGGDDEPGPDADEPSNEIVPQLVISEADVELEGPPDIGPIPAPRPAQAEEPDVDVALLVPEDGRPALGAPPVQPPSAGTGGLAVVAPDAAVPAPVRPEPDPDGQKASGTAPAETPVVVVPEADAEPPPGEPVETVAESEPPAPMSPQAEADAEVPTVENAETVAESEPPAPIASEAEAAAEPVDTAAESEAPAPMAPPAEADAEGPAIEPGETVAVAESEATVPTAPQVGASPGIPAMESVETAAESEAPAPMAPQAEADAEGPAIEPGGTVAVAQSEATAPTAPQVEASPDIPAVESVETVAEREAPAPIAPELEARPGITEVEAAEAVSEAVSGEPIAAEAAEVPSGEPAETVAETAAPIVPEAGGFRTGEPVETVAQADATAPIAAKEQASAGSVLEPAEEAVGEDAQATAPDVVTEAPSIVEDSDEEALAEAAEHREETLAAAETPITNAEAGTDEALAGGPEAPAQTVPEEEAVAGVTRLEETGPFAKADVSETEAEAAEAGSDDLAEPSEAEDLADAPAGKPDEAVAAVPSPAPSAAGPAAGAADDAASARGDEKAIATLAQPGGTMARIAAPAPAAPEASEAVAAASASSPDAARPDGMQEDKAATSDTVPETETVAMLEAPSLGPLVPEAGASRALPAVTEQPAASLVPEIVQASPAPPKLFPADSSAAEKPAAVTTPATEPIEPERQMAALAPSEIRPEPLPSPEEEQEEVADEPVDMPRAIQEQLARLGCYRSTIDGDWGPKSAKALLRYYATKKEAPDELDPNAALLAKLTSEEKVVCTRTESDRTVVRKKDGKSDGGRAVRKSVKPAPVAKKPARQKVVTPAAKPKPAPRIATQERKKKLTLGTGAFR